MKFAELADTSRLVAAAAGRLEKVELLAGCLTRMEPAEVPVGVAFLTGELPQGRIGVGYATLQKILRQTEPAREARFLLLEVSARLDEIAGVSGPGSAARKTEICGRLFAGATSQEQSFLARLIVGELRQGALEGVMVPAAARAAKVPQKEIRRALLLAGDLPEVVRAALSEGRSALANFSVQLFRPLKPMLARTAEDVAQALERLQSGAFEFKLDGARIQVHKRGKEVKIFTRQLKEVSRAIPEIVEAASRLSASELILDGEAAALREDGSSPQPFQITMRRFGSRRNVESLRKRLPITARFFDCLYLDGRSLIDQPGSERNLALAEQVPDSLLIPRLETDSPETAGNFLSAALESGYEGVVAKSLEAPYDAGRRGHAWLKIKPSHTLDLVVLAAEWGHGRRTGRLSNLHLGARDNKSGDFVMLGKTFKGMTDTMLEWQTERLQELETHRESHVVHVRPELVAEVAFDEVQASPHYPGGLALRFARIKRYRTDKKPEEADTIETVRQLFDKK